MQLNQPSHSFRTEALRLMTGVLLLTVHLFSTTALAPTMFAVLAAFERSHHVAIHQASGGLQLILQHVGPNSPMHRHGMMARALTLFAQRTTPSQSDHVIQFGAVDTLRQTITPAVAPAPELQLLAAFVPSDFLLPAPRLTSSLVNLPRPPPCTSGLLLSVRSTVLVI